MGLVEEDRVRQLDLSLGDVGFAGPGGEKVITVMDPLLSPGVTETDKNRYSLLSTGGLGREMVRSANHAMGPIDHSRGSPLGDNRVRDCGWTGNSEQRDSPLSAGSIEDPTT